MNRRELIAGAGLALVAVATAHADKPAPKPAAPAAPGGLAVAAANCTRVAQACLRHCLAMLATGNPSMAGCAKAVADLIPSVEALGAIVPGGSRHVAALAKVVGEIAKDCKAECDKHTTMAPCKECADSCAALIAEIAKV
jgi:Cys-rich four helix bundle protein (predicted Tat secretion target)